MTKPVTKRSFNKTAIAAIVLVILILASAAGAYWYYSKPKEPVTIRFIVEETPIVAELKNLVPEFEAQTGIKVIYESYSYDAAIEKEMTDFVSGSGVYDVVSAPAPNFFGYVKNGYIIPLDNYVNDPAITPADYKWDDLIPGLMNHGIVEGQRYAFPGLNYINYMSYEKGILEDPANIKAFKTRFGYEYGIPPRNLAEYKDIVAFFNTPPNRYGTTICAKRGFAAIADYMVLLAAHGGRIADDNGNPEMNSQAAKDAMKDFLFMVKHAPSGAVEFEWDANCEMMGSGNVAISIQWADHGVYFETDPNSKVAGKIGYGPFPGVETGTHVALWDGSLFTISAFSKHQREAYEFIKWVLSADTQLKWAKLGSTPCRYSVFENPELRSAWPYYQALEDSMAEGVSFTHPPLAETPQIEDIVALYLSRATIGELTVDQACAGAQAEIAALTVHTTATTT